MKRTKKQDRTLTTLRPDELIVVSGGNQIPDLGDGGGGVVGLRPPRPPQPQVIDPQIIPIPG